MVKKLFVIQVLLKVMFQFFLFIVLVAIKMIDKSRFNFLTDRNEVTILRDLSHPGVVKLLNVFEDSQRSTVCVVMEKMNGGDLLDYIMSRPERVITERQSNFLFRSFT